MHGSNIYVGGRNFLFLMDNSELGRDDVLLDIHLTLYSKLSYTKVVVLSAYLTLVLSLFFKFFGGVFFWHQKTHETQRG